MLARGASVQRMSSVASFEGDIALAAEQELIRADRALVPRTKAAMPICWPAERA